MRPIRSGKGINRQPVVVVSGLPRSGTSMMMAMLEAGGMELVVDRARAADLDNPRGYYEFEQVKQIAKDHAWLSGVRGKAVKIISLLLPMVPDTFTYQIIFMRRALPEILASQRRMLERRGEGTADHDEQMSELYEKHLLGVRDWMATQSHMEILYVDYGETISNPMETAMRLDAFLGRDLNREAMTAIVDPSLNRQGM